MNTTATKFEDISATTDPFTWRGGRGSFLAQATWGGGTVKLQYLGPNGTDYEDMGDDTTLTEDGGGNFEFPAGQLRVNVATATDVYAVIASTE
jgi:hypothetical protein